MLFYHDRLLELIFQLVVSFSIVFVYVEPVSLQSILEGLKGPWWFIKDSL